MASQSAANSPRRRQAAHHEEDEFTLRVLEFTAWAQKNLRWLVGGVVAVALIVGGYFFWQADRQARLDRAAAGFAQLQATVSSGNIPLATRDIEQYIRNYDGTPYADEARIALAQLHLQQDSASRAVEALAGAEARINSSPVGPQAALLLAAAQQAAGQPDAAVATYERVAEVAELRVHRTSALEGAAQVQSRAGKHAEAAALYERLLAYTEEGSMDRQLIQMRIEEERARAAQGS